jgi:tetratricopeptide (TPR) repeat protein
LASLVARLSRNALCVVNFVSAMAPDHPKGTEADSPIGRPELAISEFRRLIRERPGDLAAAETLADKLVIAADGAARAGHCAEALAYLETVAKWRETRGDQSRALELRKTMQRLELEYLESQLGFGHAADTAGPAGDSRSPLPSRSSSAATRDIRVQARQALTCVKRGDAVGAAKYLTEEMAEGNPRLLLAIAEIQLRGGKLDRGIALAERAIARDLSVGDDAVRVGLELAGRQPDAGFLIVEMVADAWAAQSKWPQAMAAFEKFILLKPDYVPAMVRLREMETAESDEASGKRVVPFRRISPTPKFRSA